MTDRHPLLPARGNIVSSGTRFKDYYDMEIPLFAQGLKFEDRSWHNDAGAFMVRDFVKGFGKYEMGVRVRLFFGDPEDATNFTGALYLVQLSRPNNDDADDEQSRTTVYMSNDLFDMGLFVSNLVGILELHYGS